MPNLNTPWQGWAELENDPAIFSTLLRECGVPSVQVEEVFDLDNLFNSDPYGPRPSLYPEHLYGSS
jgi:hypothetical protein